jgi:hypothetical protein
VERRHHIHDLLYPTGNKAFNGIHRLALEKPTSKNWLATMIFSFFSIKKAAHTGRQKTCH